MPMKLIVGICKKIGQPDYSSFGASCKVEVELDKSLEISDEASFQDHVKRAFNACREAVEEELSQQQSAPASNQVETSPSFQSDQFQRQASNGRSGNPASEKQLKYLRQLAGEIRGLGARKLDSLAQKMFEKPVAAISSLDASGLIDTLKAIKSGEVDLNAALNGATV